MKFQVIFFIINENVDLQKQALYVLFQVNNLGLDKLQRCQGSHSLYPENLCLQLNFYLTEYSHFLRLVALQSVCRPTIFLYQAITYGFQHRNFSFKAFTRSNRFVG